MQQNDNHGNIIAMARFLSNSRFPGINQIDGYWNALRRDGGVPFRADIDPRGIEDALEYAFILERIAPGIARIRIAGSHLVALLGMEVRGMPLSAFIDPDSRREFANALEWVFESPCVCKFDLASAGRIGKPKLDGQLSLLPLKNDLGDVNRALGCLSTIGAIGRAPRRFSVTRTEYEHLKVRKTGADPKAVDEPETPAEFAQAFEEPASPFRHRRGNNAKSRRRPTYLKVVK